MISRLILQIALVFTLVWSKVHSVPLEKETDFEDDDQQFIQEYAEIKHSLVHDLGYTQEFADLVEVNLKRAVREERARQKLQGIDPTRLRQASEEYDDEESTTRGPTTPGPSPGDVVRGVAGILTSLGTFNVMNFWQSFVNFFPPNHRESAQAVVDSSLGRRPGKWPTLPTTTTKLTTTTDDEIDSEESTKSAATGNTTYPSVIASITPIGGSAEIATNAPPVATVGATPAPAPSSSGMLTATASSAVAASATEAVSVSRATTAKYTVIKRRTGTVNSNNNQGLSVDAILLAIPDQTASEASAAIPGGYGSSVSNTISK